jgi:hypothetical protein
MAGIKGARPNNTTTREETKRTTRARGQEGQRRISYFFCYKNNCTVAALIVRAPNRMELNQAQAALPLV